MFKLAFLLFRICWKALFFTLHLLPFLAKFMAWRMIRQTPYYRGFQAVQLTLLCRRILRLI